MSSTLKRKKKEKTSYNQASLSVSFIIDLISNEASLKLLEIRLKRRVISFKTFWLLAFLKGLDLKVIISSLTVIKRFHLFFLLSRRGSLLVFYLIFLSLKEGLFIIGSSAFNDFLKIFSELNTPESKFKMSLL
jgi:hypothetical protein